MDYGFSIKAITTVKPLVDFYQFLFTAEENVLSLDQSAKESFNMLL